MKNDGVDGVWLSSPLSRVESYIEQLTDLLIGGGQYDSRSEVGDILLRIEGQLQQIREEVPKPR